MLTGQQMRELDSIASRSKDGLLRAEDVEKHARDPQSSLHKKFEWDDGKAARLYRLDQARGVIEVYVERISGAETRGFVSLKADRANGGGYRRTGDALAQDITRAMLVDQLREDLAAVLKRYSYLRGIAPDVFDTVESVVMRRSKAS